MNERDYKIVKELKKRLSKITTLVDFKVFGSRAKGTEDEYSDMDVFIEVEYLDKELKEMMHEIIWEVDLKILSISLGLFLHAMR